MQYYQTDGGRAYATLSSITNRYFDIEAVTHGSASVYRIKSLQHSNYVTFTDIWGQQFPDDPSENDAYGTIDPVKWESEITDATKIKQYVQFASTASPYDIYT